MHYWYWFIAAAALFVLEMFSGTFYLLVASIALLGAGATAAPTPPMPKAIWTSATPCCCTNPNPAACGSCNIAAPIGRPKLPSPRRPVKPPASPGNPATS